MTSAKLPDYVGKNLSSTPISRHTGLSKSMFTETAATVREDVEADFARQCRVAEREAFMQKLFPVPDDLIEKVYEEVKGTMDYDGQRWKDFPPAGTVVKENALYAPFVNAANAIRTATEAATAKAKSSHGLRDVAEWVDYHSQIPRSSNPDAARIRPDCFYAHNVSKFRGVASEPNETKQSEQKNKETQRQEKLQASIWWLQIICAVEMKRKDSQDGLDIIKQLIGYLRRILREQLDRRFVFGLTLGPNLMTVWLHDRSGVLGTSTSFNIHEDPRSFIRVIAAFSVLSMEELGYDTQMKFYASPTSIVPTYRLDDEAAPIYLSAITEKQWVITTNNNEQYLTVKVLSISRAYMMQGRASLVWAVVPFKDGKITSKKLLVLKQSWRPVETDSEHEMLAKVQNAAEVTAAEMSTAAAQDANAAAEKYATTFMEGEEFVGHVQLEETIFMGGEADVTGSLIRRCLQIAESTLTPSLAVSKRSRDEAIESYLHVNATDGDIISVVTTMNASSLPTSRIHTRLLLSTFGWPLKNFKTRREAVRGIRDAIGGHGYVYYHGLLHRDISPGNIILAWCDEDVGTTGLGTKGCLIDFDRGKYGKRHKSVLDVPAKFPAVASAVADGLIPTFLVFFGAPMNSRLTIKNDAIIEGSKVKPLGSVFDYLSAAWTHVSMFSQSGETISSSILKWTKVLQKFSFRFTNQERQSGSRTGTPPYTSGEILSRERYYEVKSGLFHDAVHDIESFFWVLVHICITRSGPDAKRRAELDGDAKDHPKLHLVVYCLFDGDPQVLAFNKRTLFKTPDDFQEFIIPHFHPYFDELKPFMQEWFSLLVLAYQYVEGFEYHNIHSRVQDILDRALASMSLEELDFPAGQATVLEERRKWLSKLTEKLTGVGEDTDIVQPYDKTSPRAQRIGNATLYTGSTESSVKQEPSSPTPGSRTKKPRH